jgi:hypothetical protein
MDVHIRIISDTGISAYAIWETWFVGNNIERRFSPPLPKEIDGTIQFEHFEPDSVDRNHQIGLRVEIPNNPNPIFTYAMEPNNRCPGHYQP